jgi:ABC-2 type transport system permease protein
MKPVSKDFYLGSFIGGALISSGLGAAAALTILRSGPSTRAWILLGASGLPVAYTVVVLMVLIHKMWAAIQDGPARTTPGRAVGFLFIPLLNLFWQFRVYYGWAVDYNRYAAEKKTDAPRMPEGLGLALCILNLLCLIPYVNAVLGIVNFFIFLRYCSHACEGINALAGRQKPSALTNMVCLTKKELLHYFYSPIAYIVITLFLLMSGGTFYIWSIKIFSLPSPPQIPPLEFFFSNWIFWFGFLAFIPAITMKLFAEERRSGTMELLMTVPVSDVQVVLSKYFGSLLFFLIMWAPTLIYVGILHYFSRAQGTGLDPGPVVSAYLGTLLLGATFLSIGLLSSSLTRNQIVAYLVCFFILLAIFASFIVGFFIRDEVVKKVVDYVSFINHFVDFPRGIIDTRHVVYYLSITGLFLFLTVRVVESRKWR